MYAFDSADPVWTCSIVIPVAFCIDQAQTNRSIIRSRAFFFMADPLIELRNPDDGKLRHIHNNHAKRVGSAHTSSD